MKYVVGFVFDSNAENILLIRKKRPTWQAGKLNGIGGKVEKDESPLVAMRREFLEETGLEVDSWTHTVTLHVDQEGNAREVFVFSASGDIFKAKTCTDENIEVHVMGSDFSHPDYINNLRWIIPLCLDQNVKFPIRVEEVR